MTAANEFKLPIHDERFLRMNKTRFGYLRTIIIIALSALLLSASTVNAQDDHPIGDAAGFQQNHEYFSQLPYEAIDPGTGALVLTFTDLVLPGHGGRDLKFQRTYNSKSRRWTFGIAGYPLYISEPGQSGRPTIYSSDGGTHRTTSLQLLDATSATTIRATTNAVSTEQFWRLIAVIER